jgi:hypothetical protein
LPAQLDSLDADLATWNDRYQKAPSGSATETLARNQIREVSNRMISLVDSADMATLDINTLENLAKKYEDKYQKAPSNSTNETTYANMFRKLYDKMVTAFDRQISCAQSAQAMLETAKGLEEKYQKAPSNSKAEAIYRSLFQKAYDSVLPIYQKEVTRKSFRSLEDDGLKFADLYQQAPSNSKAEATYRQLIKIAFDASEQSLKVAKAYLTADELYRLLQEYEGKYQQAPSNSLMEAHCRNMKNILSQ